MSHRIARRFRTAGWLAALAACVAPAVQANSSCMHMIGALDAPALALQEQRALLARLGTSSDPRALLVAALAARSLQFPWTDCSVPMERPMTVPASLRARTLAQRAADAGGDEPAVLFMLLSTPRLIDDPQRREALLARLLERDGNNLAVWMIALDDADKAKDDDRIDALLADAARAGTGVTRYRTEVMRWFIDVPGDDARAEQLAPLSDAQIAEQEPLAPEQVRAVAAEVGTWTGGYPGYDAVRTSCVKDQARRWSEARVPHCHALARRLVETPKVDMDLWLGLLILRKQADPADAALVEKVTRATSWQNAALLELRPGLDRERVRMQLLLHQLRTGLGDVDARIDLLRLNGVSIDPPPGYTQPTYTRK